MIRHLSLALCLLTLPLTGQSAAKPGIVASSEIEHLMPSEVFFHSQTATVQLRNSAAIRYPDGTITMAGLVDTSGYSSSQRETYQFYLLTDVPLRVGDQRLAPGAYGCGFVNGQDFVVMDLGGNTLLHAGIEHDAAIVHPRPLQMVAGMSSEAVRLYLGRNFVTLARAK
jgi:hypothetical protein